MQGIEGAAGWVQWSEGFKVTAAACNQGRWCVVMATTSLYTHQVVETDFQYPSEAIHLRWDAGENSPPCSPLAGHIRTCTLSQCRL